MPFPKYRQEGSENSKLEAPARAYHYRTNTNAALWKPDAASTPVSPAQSYPKAMQLLSSSTPPIQSHPLPPSLLDRNPRNRNHNIHALLLRGFPLVAICAVLVVVPEGTDGAVHAAAAVLLWLGRRADVLDHGAVGDVFVGGLGGLGGGRGAGFVDEGFEDGVLGGC